MPRARLRRARNKERDQLTAVELLSGPDRRTAAGARARAPVFGTD